MIESTPSNATHEFAVNPAGSDVLDLLRKGTEVAHETYGFDQVAALAYDHPELHSQDLEERRILVEQTSVGMAFEAGLDGSYFDDATNVVLLNAIADSWVSNEEKAIQNPYDERIAREREMLVETLLMLAGKKSSALLEIAEKNPALASQFMNLESEKEREDVLDSFYETITNADLSERVLGILLETGDGSFLAKQREMLGITDENEQPFTVRVLDIGDIYDIQLLGGTSEVSWPKRRKNETGLERHKNDIDFRRAVQKMNLQTTYAEQLETNQSKYDEQFTEEFGELPVAFVRLKDGQVPEIVLQLGEALAVVNTRDGNKTKLDNETLESRLAFLRHEYAHTQKKLIRGNKYQLGLMLEERKAELVSDDRQGYSDVKLFFTDLFKATGIKTLDILEDSLTQDNALARVLSQLSNSIGLRNALLLMVNKPLPYENDPDHEKRFINLKCLIEQGDVSVLDIAIRETLKRRGDGHVAANIRTWIEKAKQKEIYDPEFIRSAVISDRIFNGLGRMVPYILQGLELEEQRQNLPTRKKHK